MIGLLLIFLLIVVLLSFRIFYENHTFVMRYYEVEKKMGSQDEGGWKIVFLSDLHNKEYGSGNQRLLGAISLLDGRRASREVTSYLHTEYRMARDYSPTLAQLRNL